MKKMLFYKSYFNIPGVFLTAMLTVFTMSSCMSSESDLQLSETSSEALKVSAEVAQELHSRAYQAQGTVTEGTYYMIYPPQNGGNALATASFDGIVAGTGTALVTAADGVNELTWNMVQNVPNPTFYLDNVSPSLGTISGNDPTVLTFDQSVNPFVAGLFDMVTGSNDLLWGSKQVGRGTKKINFDLHHYMARLVVEITADETYATEEGALDLNGATVYITQLIQTPSTFNRLDGTLGLGENPTYEILMLVDPNSISWGDVTPNPEDTNLNVYTTQDFVVPPQTLLDDEYRPQLVIILNNGRTFSGYLPHAMNIELPGYDNPYPVALAFLRERILKIKTVISETPPELVFMPVEVIEWVDKGEFDFTARQAGIYKADDFYSLIENYVDYNYINLFNYGYLDSNKDWVFNFFNSVTLDYNQIAGSMPVVDGKPNYSFVLSGYTVTIINDGNPYSVTGLQLKNIVSGTTSQP